ncbi:uncharacterized protein LOC111044543 isoform X2 [Nilaparvata lugens]|uniref:uncharacterized protein LOC111044543 isoform X2 n=1 Tax=Nilaparvata lugens TaxID=108931 RepID=UPI00193D0CB7|nr:uncharacterized protein LOC111044543 isoform X2 [Nilaparvata lugens]
MMKSKNSIPERWLDYTRVGNPLRGTPFICFKTPLKSSFDQKIEPQDRFTVEDLVKIVPNLGLIIDLTNTDRYNDISEYRKRAIKYKKVMCQGHMVPSLNSVKQFFNAVDEYVYNPQSAGKLIGVHCTHGVNRTGYLVCRYMIQRLGFRPNNAISEFEDARGHGIERKEYLDHLKSEMENMPYNIGKAGALNKFLKFNFGPKSTNSGIPELGSRILGGPGEMFTEPAKDFFPNRGPPDMRREPIFPQENEKDYRQWQSQPQTQPPEEDLRDRLISGFVRNFNNKSGNEMAPETSFQKTFYPRSNPGSQYQPESNRPQMGPTDGGLAPFPRGALDQRHTTQTGDYFEPGFFESNQEVDDMGYTRRRNNNYNIGPNDNFLVNQGERGMTDQVGPMQRSGDYNSPGDQGRPGILNRVVQSLLRGRESSKFPGNQGRPEMPSQGGQSGRDFPPFPVDQGRSGMLERNELFIRDRDFPQFPMDQDRPGINQFGTMQRDRDFSQFANNQEIPGMQNNIGPMQRDFSQFPLDQGRPGIQKQVGPIQRERDLSQLLDDVGSKRLAAYGTINRDDGPIPDMAKMGGSALMGPNVNILSSAPSSVIPTGPNWNPNTGFGGLNSGSNAMTKNNPGGNFNTAPMQGRNDIPMSRSMDSAANDNFPPTAISIRDRLGEPPSRERSMPDRQFSSNYQSRSRSGSRGNRRSRSRSRSRDYRRSKSRDRRSRRSRSTSRRRSRSNGRSEKRMASQYGGDLFTRRGEVADKRSRSGDRSESRNQYKKYEKDYDREPQKGFESVNVDYSSNPRRLEEWRPYDDEILKQKLEQISEMSDKITKAVSLMRTFNFPQEFYDDPKNRDFIVRARKFQTLSNEIENSLESFNSKYGKSDETHWIVSKKTVKLDSSEYRKLQPPPEFIDLTEPECPSLPNLPMQMRRGPSDSRPLEYDHSRQQYNPPSGY